MRVLDTAVHGWDLARAIGADEALDDDVVTFLIAYTAAQEAGSHGSAFAAPDGPVPRNASAQDRLLHRLGRHPNVTEKAP